MHSKPAVLNRQRVACAAAHPVLMNHSTAQEQCSPACQERHPAACLQRRHQGVGMPWRRLHKWPQAVGGYQQNGQCCQPATARCKKPDMELCSHQAAAFQQLCTIATQSFISKPCMSCSVPSTACLPACLPYIHHSADSRWDWHHHPGDTLSACTNMNLSFSPANTAQTRLGLNLHRACLTYRYHSQHRVGAVERAAIAVAKHDHHHQHTGQARTSCCNEQAQVDDVPPG